MIGTANTTQLSQTPLYPITSKLIRDEWEKLRRNQITPWAFFNSGKPMRVVDFYGKEIKWQGVEFEGSPRHVFWGRYIEPFLEDITFRMIDHTLQLCRDKRHDAKPAILETGELLKRLARNAYGTMADIDQRLRGRGWPDRASKRSVDGEIATMERFIDARVGGELALWKRRGKLNEFYHTHPFLFWFLGFLISAVSIILAIIAL